MRRTCAVLLLLLGSSAPAWAQDDPDWVGEEPPPDATPDPPEPTPDPAVDPTSEPSIDESRVQINEPAKPPAPRPPPVPIRFPYIFNASTARLLPGAVIYTGGGVDTGGGLSSVLQVGLGDVAEFGVGVTDLVRARTGTTGKAEAIFPYVTATFKMGVAESRLFKQQPALALGFRKSFEHESDGHSTRIAELYLVASKDFGSRTTVHLGGVLWDASLSTPGAMGDTIHELNDQKLIDQLRAFGGIEITPLPKAQIMVEMLYMPEFVYGATAAEDDIELNATLAWGVRYLVAEWVVLEAGVRIPDIDEVNLLDAQIFGQVKFVNRGFRRLVGLE